MSTGQKVALSALVVLGCCVAGYYLVVTGQDDAESDMMSAPTTLPDPTPPDQAPSEPTATPPARQPQRPDPPRSTAPPYPAQAPPPNDPALTPSPSPARTDPLQLNTYGSLSPNRSPRTRADAPAGDAAADANGAGERVRRPASEPNRPAPRAMRPEVMRMRTPRTPPRPAIDNTRPPTGDAGPARDETTYTVQQDDSLWKIARSQLGAGSQWRLIARANGLPDNATLQPGQRLIIPKPEPERGPVAERTDADPLGLGLSPDMRTVTVREDDSLWDIAVREYKDGTKWRLIYTANKSRMSSPTDLHPGDELLVPPLPDDED